MIEKKSIAGYKIINLIGEGGMGVVYRARDEILDRDLAVKLIRPGKLTTTGKERFIREVRACSRINHPNIVTVYSAGEEDDYLYMAMELLEGETLREKIEEGRVETVRAVRWIIDLLGAVECLHREGVIHRDLKPENISISPDEDVKLMDFGIARLSSSATITVAGTAIGTFQYMSPEQTMGTDIDPRSDIFSIGIVLFQLLTGELPFTGEHPMAVMYAIANEPPSTLEKYSGAIPEKLIEIIRRALEKDPEKRFPDAESFSRALKSFLGDEEDSGEVKKFVLRPRAAVIIISAVLISAAAVARLTLYDSVADQDLAARYNESGQSYREGGRYQEAADQYRKAIEVYPEWHIPWNNLAALEISRGRLDAADSLLDEALSRKYDYTAALYNRGQVNWDLGKIEDAEKYFRASIEADSSFYSAYNNLGALYLETGRDSKAAEVLDMALQKEKARPSSDRRVRGFLLKNRGMAALKLGSGDPLNYWDQAISLIPENIELRRLLADYYRSIGQEQKVQEQESVISALEKK